MYPRQRSLWPDLKEGLPVQSQAFCDFGVSNDVGRPDVGLEEGLLAEVVAAGEEAQLLLFTPPFNFPRHPHLTLTASHQVWSLTVGRTGGVTKTSTFSTNAQSRLFIQ